MNKTKKNLKDILIKAERGTCISSRDMVDLLSIENPQEISMLFEVSRKLRRQHFGNRVFLYGFIYTSTYCRNDCNFCFFRKSNFDSTRYRKAKAEILSAANSLAESGVHLIDLTMGEDPVLFNDTNEGFEVFLDVVAAVQNSTRLPVMVSPGVMTATQLKMLAKAGATWYACYQETHNHRLFKDLRKDQDFDTRMAAKLDAYLQGLLIEEGLLCGVGETLEDLAHSLVAMKDLHADQIRAMTFIPQRGTPMAVKFPVGAHRETLLIAVMRLLFPNMLIPASLDVDGIDGLKPRLDAGANVVTSIVPPGAGLAGVARHSLGIENGSRTVRAVTSMLSTCGLEAATPEEYGHWIVNRQRANSLSMLRKDTA
jgi:methylornithine synthase